MQESVFKCSGLQAGRRHDGIWERCAGQLHQLCGSENVIEVAMRGQDEANCPALLAGAVNQLRRLIDRVNDQRFTSFLLPTM